MFLAGLSVHLRNFIWIFLVCSHNFLIEKKMFACRCCCCCSCVCAKCEMKNSLKKKTSNQRSHAIISFVPYASHLSAEYRFFPRCSAVATTFFFIIRLVDHWFDDAKKRPAQFICLGCSPMCSPLRWSVQRSSRFVSASLFC